MTDEEMDHLFQALAHVHRRRILDIVGLEPGIHVGVLASKFDVTRIAIMNHLTVLERARLIISERSGTARRLYLNATPIRMIYERWTSEFSGHWAAHLLRIKHAAEHAAGTDGGSRNG